jgi:multicomponent Na+:H+ antiporter subunit D
VIAVGGLASLNLGEHLPALQIALPLLSAPLCVLLRRARLCWGLSMLVTAGALVMSLTLLARVLALGDGGAISYHLGGWEPPWGIEYRIDLLNAFVLVIVTGISAVVMAAAPRSLEAEIPRDRHHLFYAAYLLCMTGLLGITITGDVFNIFVFLEISSLSAYALISMGRTRRAVTSAYQYLVMGTIGGTLLLLGIGLLYMVTGTLNIMDLAVRLADVGPNRTVLVALACIVAGISIKLALFPLHVWLPNAYTYAPAVVTAFLAATATKVAYYVLVRFVFTIFGASLAFGDLHLDKILMPLAILAMFGASLVAIYQEDVKRMLAWSSVAQIGYMVLGLALANESGLTGGLVHLFNHALMKSGLFLVLACFALRIGSTRLEDLAGVGRSMPFTMGAFVLGGLSLIGVPLTAGFVSKWYLVRGALEAGLWPLAAAILLSSLLAVAYIWRVVEVAWFREPATPVVRPSPISLLAPAWILLLGTLYFGVHTSFTVGTASSVARMLLGANP